MRKSNILLINLLINIIVYNCFAGEYVINCNKLIKPPINEVIVSGDLQWAYIISENYATFSMINIGGVENFNERINDIAYHKHLQNLDKNSHKSTKQWYKVLRLQATRNGAIVTIFLTNENFYKIITFFGGSILTQEDSDKSRCGAVLIDSRNKQYSYMTTYDILVTDGIISDNIHRNFIISDGSITWFHDELIATYQARPVFSSNDKYDILPFRKALVAYGKLYIGANGSSDSNTHFSSYDIVKNTKKHIVWPFGPVTGLILDQKNTAWAVTNSTLVVVPDNDCFQDDPFYKYTTLSLPYLSMSENLTDAAFVGPHLIITTNQRLVYLTYRPD